MCSGSNLGHSRTRVGLSVYPFYFSSLCAHSKEQAELDQADMEDVEEVEEDETGEDSKGAHACMHTQSVVSVQTSAVSLMLITHFQSSVCGVT